MQAITSSVRSLKRERGCRSGLRKMGLIVWALALAVGGCRDAEEATSLPVPDEPTFGSHVGEILHRECTPCHREGGVAPFPLESYYDAWIRADLIAQMTEERRMPPWLPKGGDYRFADERRLSDREVAILQKWAELGAPEGDPDAAPALGEITGGWILGQPDLILEMSEPYTVPALEQGQRQGRKGQDVFRSFVIPMDLSEMKHVRAVEFQPDDRRVVHHAIMSVDHGSGSRLEDARDPQPGFDGAFSSSRALQPAGFVLGWTPGVVPRWNPEGLTWSLEPGVDFVIQAHFMPLEEEVDVQLRVGLYFGEAPAERTRLVKNMYLLGRTIDIPAGNSRYRVEDSFEVPVDVEILGLYPHAHYLARTMEFEAVLPNGIERTLIRIEEWDFDWQDMYTFENPVALPAGTQLFMRWVYDNSAENPRNPHDPPQRVTFGFTSADEMSELWIQARPKEPSEFSVLQEAVDRKRVDDHLELFRHLVRLNSDDASAHANLGALYGIQDQIDRSVEHYRRALEIRPDFARAHYEWAVLVEERGEWDDAMHHYREAIRTFPEYVAAHLNVGSLLFREDRLDEAEAHYRRAVKIAPEDAEVHIHLGNLAKARGRLQEAVDHYRAAVEAAPGVPNLHFNLASNLILLGVADEAVEQLEEGARLAPQDVAPLIAAGWMLAADPDAVVRQPRYAIRVAEGLEGALGEDHPLVLDLLAAAHAAGGDFEQALRFANRSYELAVAAGSEELARSISERVGLYRQARPFIARGGPYAGSDP